ncbi:hypothetical protein FG386_001041 [Cryptosporidium ryanae]|uniref:uncharacterized protein n=1 Tax=Cryptosporidium ryanae TaxID=515981 RepID=UPI00351AA269|nr:hypothetical protein FG386_001041 [Cryptosporidium ryanae]
MKNEIEIQVSKEHGDAEIVDSNKEENSTLIAELEEEKCDVSANNQESTNSRDCRERDLKTKQDNQIDNECGYHLHLDEVSDDENDELLIEVAKSGAPFDKYRSLKKLPLLLWDDNIKSKLKNKIRKTSKMMYLKYGKNGTCFDGVDYIPYFCSSHNTFTCDTKKGGYDLENTETVIFESRSCTDCKLSILDNFIKVIVEAVDKHTEFPPTIQRICELLCYPDCYTNTKSFLYALDKVS